MTPRFLESAVQDLLEACRYYNAQDPECGARLENEVDRALVHLCMFPRAARSIDSVYRSHKLRRFPYHLIYRIDDDHLLIVAVAHSARKPFTGWKMTAAGPDPGFTQYCGADRTIGSFKR
jgi:plasmid stabilization system protein ParE